MKERIIEFETAKLAKEKGFTYPTISFYEGKRLIEYCLDGSITDPYLDIQDWNSVSVDISAPTQSLLQKWLREKHNIHVWASPGNTKRPKGTFEVNVSTNNETIFYHYGYENYEEALGKGLQEALKLIKTD